MDNNPFYQVTRETGRNRFRQWENEQVTWLLGQEEDGGNIGFLYPRHQNSRIILYNE